jgi:hypothetical protein
VEYARNSKCGEIICPPGFFGWPAKVSTGAMEVMAPVLEADIQSVAKDILALTKLNYNACRLGESEPGTIGFSDAMGEILVSNPTVTRRSPKFKFYI